MHSYTRYIETQNNTELYGRCNKELSGGGSTERYPRNVITFASDKQKCKLHPTQKPIPLLKKLIEIFTDEGDTVIDPVAGSGSTLRACAEMNRSCYGFEIKKDFYKAAQENMLSNIQLSI